MSPINQAVILCGGLGTRLKPFTNHSPKPMVLVNKRPFLLYLLEQLAEQGIKKFTLLTGYLGQEIYQYFKNGDQWGWTIDYSHGPVEWDTGRRLWEARSILESRYLLLYSDNFAVLKLTKLLDTHTKNGLPLTLTLSRKQPGNIRIEKSGIVSSYDKKRIETGLNFVEIGYMIIERDAVFRSYDQPDVSFSDILSKMVKEKKVSGFIQADAYHSISDPIRLKKMENYLSNTKILLIDRDGTINARRPRGEYVSEWKYFEWIPETKQALKALAKKGFKFIVISNQAGVSRGMINKDKLVSITQNMEAEFAKESIQILHTYICEHHWEEDCNCRKPKPGLFYQAAKDWLFRLDNTLFVGDDSRDCQAALNAGCGSIFLGDPTELNDLKEEERPISVHKNFLEAVPKITNYFDKYQL